MAITKNKCLYTCCPITETQGLGFAMWSIDPLPASVCIRLLWRGKTRQCPNISTHGQCPDNVVNTRITCVLIMRCIKKMKFWTLLIWLFIEASWHIVGGLLFMWPFMDFDGTVDRVQVGTYRMVCTISSTVGLPLPMHLFLCGNSYCE